MCKSTLKIKLLSLGKILWAWPFLDSLPFQVFFSNHLHSKQLQLTCLQLSERREDLLFYLTLS